MAIFAFVFSDIHIYQDLYRRACEVGLPHNLYNLKFVKKYGNLDKKARKSGEVRECYHFHISSSNYISSSCTSSSYVDSNISSCADVNGQIVSAVFILV